MIKKGLRRDLRRDETRRFTRHQIRRQDLLVKKLVEHKKSRLIFILASLLDRGMQRVNWLPPRTIVAHVFLKIIFRGCPIIHSLSNGAMLERLVNATL